MKMQIDGAFGADGALTAGKEKRRETKDEYEYENMFLSLSLY